MKLNLRKFATLLALAACFSIPAAFAAEKDHDHGAKKKGGPNGGRVITSVEPHIEFLVTKDRTVEITVLNDDYKPAALGTQSVTVIAGERAKPTKMSFTAKDGKLVSDVKLPEGSDYPVVVQIKTKPDAKVVNEKFNLDLAKCPTCKYLEYACICDHADDEKDEKKNK
jgi:hypothetical protein